MIASPPRSGRYLLALSGGADSTALLLLLAEKRVDFFAAHCNFHLRGEESDRDEQFCRQLCADNGVEIVVRDFDVDAYRRERGGSVEMACRDLRYAWFRELKEARGCARILTAHHADDNTETLLLNLMRGAGVRGLKGMVEDDGEILRPLLRRTRSEILGYLRGRGQEFVTDSTNSENEYARNFLRNSVLPLLQTRWPGAVGSICRSLENIGSAEACLGEIYHCEWADLKVIPSALLALPFEELLNRKLSSLGFPATAAREVIRASESRNVGAEWRAGGVTLFLERDGLHITDDASSGEQPIEVSTEILENSQALMAHIRRERDLSTLYIPAEEAGKIEWRHPRPSDRIRPLGMRGSQLLSDVFKDAKLTRLERQSVPLAVYGPTGEIVWAAGLKRSGLLLIQPETVRVAAIKIKPRK